MEQGLELINNLIDPGAHDIRNMTLNEASARVASGSPDLIQEIQGSFALLGAEGIRVRMARTLDRPMRFFLAKREAGPALVVSDRISTIADFLREHGLGDQFHPSYTRMVPAHHVLELELRGCPDPSPRLSRFFSPQRATLDPDLEHIGEKYIGALHAEITDWLRSIDEAEPIGVAFSGGIDSGAVLLLLHHAIRETDLNPARLKAFTLCVEGGGPDTGQARRFLEQLGLAFYLETIDVEANALSLQRTVEIIEDYKPLDVQAAAALIALLGGIRERYPDWKYIVDGDGGDENLKDYPIEENPELTIRSVLSNSLLYQEGWGVGSLKHSEVYSGGQSRSCTRTWAPARHFGFSGFSPYTRRPVIALAEAIPFIELTDWSHERLYDLKGRIVAHGVHSVTGLEMPVFEKRRFQHGIAPGDATAAVFPAEEAPYRKLFHELYP